MTAENVAEQVRGAGNGGHGPGSLVRSLDRLWAGRDSRRNSRRRALPHHAVDGAGCRRSDPQHQRLSAAARLSRPPTGRCRCDSRTLAQAVTAGRRGAGDRGTGSESDLRHAARPGLPHRGCEDQGGKECCEMEWLNKSETISIPI